MTGERPERPIYFYAAGPMAAGKSHMLERFEERALYELEGEGANRYQDDLEAIYQKYKLASRYCIQPSFEIIKDMLPEFESSGGNFGLVRAEASALDQAARQWAQDIGSCLMRSDLGDGDMALAFYDDAQRYDIVLLGVTCDPLKNLERLQARNAETGESISQEELAKSIIGFSQAESFMGGARLASRALLVSSDYDAVVAAWENGERHVLRPNLLRQFEGYRGLSPAELLRIFDAHAEAGGPAQDR